MRVMVAFSTNAMAKEFPGRIVEEALWRIAPASDQIDLSRFDPPAFEDTFDNTEELALLFALHAMSERPSNYAVGLALNGNQEFCIAIIDGEHRLSASREPCLFIPTQIEDELQRLLQRFVDPDKYTGPEHSLQVA